MKLPFCGFFAAIVSGFGAGFPIVPVHAAEPTIQHFREVDSVFANPGQGWMAGARVPATDPRFPASVVYLRFGWADVEPEPGRYDWKRIDDAIAAWGPRGATVAMRVMATSAHSRGYYTTPKWVFDAGCRGFEYEVGGDDPTTGGKRIPRIEPDYADAVFLAQHGAFLAALGRRYDGHPGIAVIDIGSYGQWGEWHTKHPVAVAVRRQIVDLYLKAFRRTPLVFMSDDAEVLPYALEHGTGFRRDGVGSPWHEQNWIGSKKYAAVAAMADTWRRAPVVFEWYGDYDYLQRRKWSFDAAVEFMLRNHVTLINDNIGRFPPEARSQLDRLARLAGARFVLRALTQAGTVKRGAGLNLNMAWANTGVGKLHLPYQLRFTLVDRADKAVATGFSRVDPRAWLPGEHRVMETWTVSDAVAAGDYRLVMKLVRTDGEFPPFRLAFEAPEVDGGRVVGRVRVE